MFRSLQILEKLNINKTENCDNNKETNPNIENYKTLKLLSNEYNNQKQKFKKEMKTWPSKSDSLYNFPIENSWYLTTNVHFYFWYFRLKMGKNKRKYDGELPNAQEVTKRNLSKLRKLSKPDNPAAAVSLMKRPH